MKAPAQARQSRQNHAAQPVQRRVEAMSPRVSPLGGMRGKSNNTGLPDRLKSGVESLSGVNLDHVRVHYNSAKPAQLSAHAYAQGGDIHLAHGQERHLPHEAWHVAQQAQGRVKPTLQVKGSPINDNQALEKEADTMGALALQRKEARPTATSEENSQRLGNGVVQRIHVHLSGSGVDAKDPSVGKKFGEAYADTPSGDAKKSHVISGPGFGEEADTVESALGGPHQTYASQDKRIINAVKVIGEAWLGGDKEILLSGFSRGGGNAIEVARFINIHGLLSSNGAVIEGTKGAKIKFLGLLDPVPATPSPGYARKITGVSMADEKPLAASIDPVSHSTKPAAPPPHQVNIAAEAVDYKDLDIPPNVEFVTSVLAHAETRGHFEAYRTQVADPEATKSTTDVIPFAVHSQVGGTAYGGTESPGALLSFDALVSAAEAAGIPFKDQYKLPEARKHELIQQLFETPRAAEDLTTRALIAVKPLLRTFAQHKIGPTAGKFVTKITQASNPEALGPFFHQFGITPPYATAPLSVGPHEYLAALTSNDTSPSRSAALPRTGGVSPLVPAALTASIFPQLLLFLILVLVLRNALRRH